MTDPAFRRPALAGNLLMLVLFAGVGGWAGLTRISGAVIAPGAVDTETGRQVIQHPEGGRIAAVLVKEGELVSAGALLIRLDGSAIKSDLARAKGRLAETLAERARLLAERDGKDQVAFAADPLLDPDAITVFARAQTRLFNVRLATHKAELQQIALRREQIGDQIRGLTAGIQATHRLKALLSDERARQQDLISRGLQPIARLQDIDRELARLDGQLGGQTAARAEAESRVSEARLETLRLDAARRENAAADLRVVLADEADLRETIAGLLTRLAGLDLRAPVAGAVFGMRALSVAAALGPGEAALFIMPQDQPFIVQARISLTDIDAVHVGQPVHLRLLALNPRSTADMAGRVVTISADAYGGEKGASPHYLVRINVPRAELDRLLPATLLPGMPVEVMAETGQRSALSYLTDPLTRYFHRAFREG